MKQMLVFLEDIRLIQNVIAKPSDLMHIIKKLLEVIEALLKMQQRKV